MSEDATVTSTKKSYKKVKRVLADGTVEVITTRKVTTTTKRKAHSCELNSGAKKAKLDEIEEMDSDAVEGVESESSKSQSNTSNFPTNSSPIHYTRFWDIIDNSDGYKSMHKRIINRRKAHNVYVVSAQARLRETMHFLSTIKLQFSNISLRPFLLHLTASSDQDALVHSKTAEIEVAMVIITREVLESIHSQDLVGRELRAVRSKGLQIISVFFDKDIKHPSLDLLLGSSTHLYFNKELSESDFSMNLGRLQMQLSHLLGQKLLNRSHNNNLKISDQSTDLDNSSSSGGDRGSSTSSLPSLHCKISRPDLDQTSSPSNQHYQYLQHQALIGLDAEIFCYNPPGSENINLSGEGEAENQCWHNKGSLPSIDLAQNPDQLLEDSRLVEDLEVEGPLNWRGFGDMHRIPAYHRYVVHISDTSLGHRGIAARSLTDLTASRGPSPLGGGSARQGPGSATARTAGWVSLGVRGLAGPPPGKFELERRKSEQLIRFDCDLRDMWLENTHCEKSVESGGGVNRTTRTGSNAIDKTLESLETKGSMITETLGRGRFGFIVAAKSSIHENRPVAIKLVERTRECHHGPQNLGHQNLCQQNMGRQNLGQYNVGKLRQLHLGQEQQNQLQNSKQLRMQQLQSSLPQQILKIGNNLEEVIVGIEADDSKLMIEQESSSLASNKIAVTIGAVTAKTTIEAGQRLSNASLKSQVSVLSSAQSEALEKRGEVCGTIEVINSDLNLAVLFEEEPLGRLSHDNVIRMYDYYTSNEGVYCLVLECCSQESLRNLLAQSSGNLFVEDTCKRFGTPGYLPPEVLARRTYCPLAADIWALGVTLYVMLTSRLPYPLDTAEALPAMRRSLHLPPSESVKLTKEVAQVIRGLLHSVVQARYSENKVRCSAWLNSPTDPIKPRMGTFYRAGQFIKYRDSSPERHAKLHLGI